MPWFNNRPVINSITGEETARSLTPLPSPAALADSTVFDKTNEAAPSWPVAMGCVADARAACSPARRVHCNQLPPLTCSRGLAQSCRQTYTRTHVPIQFGPCRPPPYPGYIASLSFVQRPEEQLSYLEARVRTVLLCHTSPWPTHPTAQASLRVFLARYPRRLRPQGDEVFNFPRLNLPAVEIPTIVTVACHGSDESTEYLRIRLARETLSCRVNLRYFQLFAAACL